jgi:hypothetical protein
MPIEIIPYEPIIYTDLADMPEVGTAWNGVERILHDIIIRFNIPQVSALEFGVEHAFSTVALAHHFRSVDGVDTFVGDEHSGYKADHFKETAERVREKWPNITLHQARFQDWIKFDNDVYDLIHVDIVHTYNETYRCARWAIDHAPVVICHDTVAFPEVAYAVGDVSISSGCKFYHYDKCENSPHGLGILVRQMGMFQELMGRTCPGGQ